MTESRIDIGDGRNWAWPRGADEHFRRLIRYMGNLTLAEFVELTEAIQEDFPDSEIKSEFIHLLGLTKTLPAAVIRRVLLHPVWIYWVRSTRQLARAWHESKRPAPQLVAHLHPEDRSTFGYLLESLTFFPHLALAAHLLAGKEIELTIQARKIRYLSLPGTGFSGDLLEASFQAADHHRIPARIRAVGLHNSLLLGRPEHPLLECAYTIQDHQAQPMADPDERARHWLETVSTASRAFEIDNRDNRILESWVSREIYPGGTEVGPAAPPQIPAWRERLGEAFDVLKRCCPLLEEELSSLLRCVVPVETNHPEHSISCSSRDFWGAIQLSPHPGVALTEVLAHEYRHNLLNALLEVDSLIEPSCSQKAEFYSPWRPDPRPLVGLLHGIYSFVEVVGFYESYLDQFGSQAPQVVLAEERIITNACRLQIAVRELAGHAKFTALGDELFDGLRRRIDRFEQDAHALNPALKDALSKQVHQQYALWLARRRIESATTVEAPQQPQVEI